VGSAASPTSAAALRSSTPFAGAAKSGGDAALEAAWNKLYRARALLEAEQAQVRDDRLVLQDERKALQRRETAVAAREAGLSLLEQQAAEAAAEPQLSSFSRVTRAPFAMARMVFGPRTEGTVRS